MEIEIVDENKAQRMRNGMNLSSNHFETLEREIQLKIAFWYVRDIKNCRKFDLFSLDDRKDHLSEILKMMRIFFFPIISQFIRFEFCGKE